MKIYDSKGNKIEYIPNSNDTHIAIHIDKDDVNFITFVFEKCGKPGVNGPNVIVLANNVLDEANKKALDFCTYATETGDWAGKNYIEEEN